MSPVARSSAPAATMQFCVECLSCNHRALLEPCDLRRYGIDGNLAALSRRLRCSRCGAHATKSFRASSRTVAARWLRHPGT
jgi:hypothetical protein